MDPTEPRTVYVTLAGYARKWAEPGAVGDDISKIGTGHVFKSTDSGETFTNISGDLPDTPANWTVLHKNHLVIGTDLGVFESCDTNGGAHFVLGTGMPNVQTSSLQFKPGDADTAGRSHVRRAGCYSLRFVRDPVCPSSRARRRRRVKPAAGRVLGARHTGGAAPGERRRGAAAPIACAARAGFRSVRVTPRGRGLRFSVVRGVSAPFTVDVFRESSGSRVLGGASRGAIHEAHLELQLERTGPRVGNGVYFVRVRIAKARSSTAGRPAFTRRGGKFRTRRQFYALSHCELLRTARLTRPVFGGSTGSR